MFRKTFPKSGFGSKLDELIAVGQKAGLTLGEIEAALLKSINGLRARQAANLSSFTPVHYDGHGRPIKS